MRRRLRAGAFAALVLIGASGCASNVGTAEPAVPAPVGSPTPSIAAEEPVSTTIISITVNDSVVEGVLQDNPATASLLAQLPLELTFSDFGGQEKLARLPAPLALDGMPAGSSAEPGTIGYYAPDQVLVLYYDSVGYFTGIVPLGTFDDVAAVRTASNFTGRVERT